MATTSPKASGVIRLLTAFTLAASAFITPVMANAPAEQSTAEKAAHAEQYAALKNYLDRVVTENGRLYQGLADQFEKGALSKDEFNRQLDQLDLRLYGNVLATHTELDDPSNIRIRGCTLDGVDITIPLRLRVNMDQLEDQMIRGDKKPVSFMNEFTSAVRGSVTDVGRVAVDKVRYEDMLAPAYQAELRAALSRTAAALGTHEGVDIFMQPLPMAIGEKPCKDLPPAEPTPDPADTAPDTPPPADDPGGAIDAVPNHARPPHLRDQLPAINDRHIP